MSAFVGTLASAQAELRTLRRLARTWVFVAAAVGTGLAAFVFRSLHHHAYSSYSPTLGGIAPEYMVSGFGGLALWTVLAGATLLVFDSRARDERDGIVETLDVRPAGNLEVLAGRVAVLAVIGWLPLAALVAAVAGLGVGAERFDWSLGGLPEPASAAAFLLVDAPAALIFWGAAVTLLSAALRNRFAVAAIALAILAALFWASFHTPLYLLPALFGPVAFGEIASDILPRFADAGDIAQRAGLTAAAVGLLIAAAALHPRRDMASRLPLVAFGMALVVVGAGVVGILAAQARTDIDERTAWAAIHSALRDHPRADIERIAGEVRIAPGEALELRLDVRLRTPPERVTDVLDLSLNPGMRVEKLGIDGRSATFRHENGLLAVMPPQPLAPNAETTLSLHATGVPDPRFAYLDGAIDPMLRTLANGQLHVLGTEASLFADDYVALMSGVRWLPSAGANFESGDPTAPRQDVFSIDLEVEVPAGWLVAAPGRREDAGGDDATARFRFRPDAPVPEVALLAARFERQAVDAATGIELELLMHPVHRGNVAFFATAIGELATGRIDVALRRVAAIGLPYPYGSLRVVETPGHLRGYRGGWRMDTAQAPPGALLLREHGFPTARFVDLLRGDTNPRRLQRMLAQHFGDNSSGGALLSVVRNFLGFQAVAAGEGAAALEQIVQEMLGDEVRRLMRDSRATPPFLPRQFVTDSASVGSFAGRAMGDTAGVYQAAAPWSLTAWQSVPKTSLASLDSSVAGAHPTGALGALVLRSHAAAKSIMDSVGKRRAYEFLGELRLRHAGGRFTMTDFEAAATDVGAPLDAVLGDWLHQTSLPGFVASNVTVIRLADSDDGEPRYQTKVHVFNGEPTPGLVSLHALPARDDFSLLSQTAPVRVAGHSAVEFGLVYSSPPMAVTINTYLSANRGAIELDPPEFDTTASVAEEPFVGARSSDWRPRWLDWIMVDDLDAGFRAESAPVGGWQAWRRGAGDAPPLDAGLPVFAGGTMRPGRWQREETLWGWGRYRRTFARALPGDGRATAAFRAELPAPGRWTLGYHLPGRTDRNAELDNFLAVAQTTHAGLGSYDIKLVAGGIETTVEFDAGAGELGWNHLGDFDLPAGEVALVVSNRSSGSLVIADAIRWRPARSSGTHR